MKTVAPWLLALLVLGVVHPAAAVPVDPLPWRPPVRTLRDFFGLPTAANASRAASLDELVEEARNAGYGVRLLVALVPLPGEFRFDQALDGIQRGFAQSGYLADRAWLPGTMGEESTPGLLLFRRDAGGSRQLAVVFLIGETPKAGVRKEALREALDLAADLQRAAADPVVGILGPSYSGSAESLRLALASWGPWERQHQGVPPRVPLRFHIATGSATGNGLENLFRPVDPSFCRTVPADADLNEAALAFLQDRMGWNLRRAVLLTESDTAYGRSLMSRQNHLTLVPFPSHISDLRNAFQEERKKDPEARPSPVQARVQDGGRTLGLDLAARERAVDLVPVSDPLTIRGNERMLANLLATVSREGVRSVGILATSVRDKLFLAEEVRRYAPDTVLFTFDSDLLYAHPQYSEVMDGTLVITSEPLFTEGAPWLPGSLRVEGRERLQFASGFQQGTYEAVRHLLGADPGPPPQAWIAAVGNGSLWPVARLPLGSGSARLCGGPAFPPEPRLPVLGEGDGFAAKDDLQLLLAAVVLALLGLWLGRQALLVSVQGASIDVVRGNRRLLAGGLLLLASAAGVLLAVVSLPLWARGPRLAGRPSQAAFLLAMAAIYAFLVFLAARAAFGKKGTALRAVLGVFGGVLLLEVLGLGVLWLCVPGVQVELFHLRARALSSGLSPLVSLAALGGALYIWAFQELARRRLIARLAVDCPLVSLGEPAAAGAERPVESMGEVLFHTFPRPARFWLLPAIAFLPPTALLWGTVQPIAETQGYGRGFLLLLVLAVALAALSFYRFLRLWTGAYRILRRLDHASPELAEAFTTVGKEVSWRPIGSFGWRIPPFRMLVLSLRKLRALAAAGLVEIPGGVDALDSHLRSAFEHEAGRELAREIESRNALERAVAQACLDLRGKTAEPPVREFLALRVAAFLRYVFAHMRSCLIGSLVPGLLILIAVTSYAFQPKQFVSLAVWLALAVALALTAWVFIQMDRNATLSRIGDTQPGRVTFDRPFLVHLFTYVGIPLLGLVAAQFPAVGRLLGSLADQLLRVAGGG
jgi:hypothetical protein